MNAPETVELGAALRAERKARLHGAMAETGIDLLVVVGNAWRCDSLRYSTGAAVTEGFAAAFIERDGGTTLVVESPGEADRLALENPDLEVSWSPTLIADVERRLAAADLRRVGLAPRTALPARLATGPAGASVGKATAMLEKLLLRKSPAEIEAVRRAAALADAGYQVFCAAARVGRPEYQLVADVEAFFREHGCPDNFMIVGSGGVEVRGMHPPGERRIAKGDLVTTELTPCVEGYYAQICRTLVVGEPSEVQRRVFALFNEAMEAGIAAVRPGVTAADVARALNDVFRARGLGDYVTSEYTRVRGHALGLGTGQRPSLLENVDMVLEEDMTIIVHPNTYHPEVGYFVHGDMLRVTATGAEVLCGTPRELFQAKAG
jgi:Xaa-Pro aminopeptidase